MMMILLFLNAAVAFQLMWRRQMRLSEAVRIEDVREYFRECGHPRWEAARKPPLRVMKALQPELYRAWKLSWLYSMSSIVGILGYAQLTDL